MAGFTVQELDAIENNAKNKAYNQPPPKNVALTVAVSIGKNVRAAAVYFYDQAIKSGKLEETAKVEARIAANKNADDCISQKKVVLYYTPTAAQQDISKQNAVAVAAALTNKNKDATGTLPADFSEQIYLDNNPDIANAVKNKNYPSGANHYINFGWKENRVYSVATLAAKNKTVVPANTTTTTVQVTKTTPTNNTPTTPVATTVQVTKTTPANTTPTNTPTTPVTTTVQVTKTTQTTNPNGAPVTTTVTSVPVTKTTTPITTTITTPITTPITNQGIVKKSSSDVLTNMAENSKLAPGPTDEKPNYLYWIAGTVIAAYVVYKVTRPKPKTFKRKK